MNKLSYTMTNENITVYHGGKTHTIREGSPNFKTLRRALIDADWQTAADSLQVAPAVSAWSKGRFKLKNGKVEFNGEELPDQLTSRIVEMSTNGEDPTPVCLFWERVKKNPSWRSVHQLFPFLKNIGIPLTKDGKFLAYKSVRGDFKDHHSGTISNVVGSLIEMPRNEISDDPNTPCHEGLHVGALEYARSFGTNDRRIVICEIDPEDVVCVPYDSNQQKMRVCRYKVVGNHNGQDMSSTSIDVDVNVEESDAVDETDSKPGEISVPKKFAKIHALNAAELLNESTDKLREYASKGLKIVGASKIPGGKVALIAAIEEVRR